MPSKAEQITIAAVRGAMIGVILACLLYGDQIQEASVKLQAKARELHAKLSRRPLTSIEQEVSEHLDTLEP